MIDSSVARRYARALYALEADTPARTHDARLANLEAFAGLLAGSAELSSVLLEPGQSEEARQKVVAALCAQLKTSAPVESFLHVLVERHRLGSLAEIVNAYRELADRQAGRVRATAAAAAPLGAAEVAALEKSLSAATAKSVVLTAKVDESLLGGVVAEVGGTRYDGSLRTQLAKLRQELLG